VPCDYRIFDKKRDALTKNDHFSAMVKAACERGFRPACVVFDSWYSGLENLKMIRSYQWVWLTRLKSNPKVNPDRQGLRAVSEVEIGEQGRVVWLEGYGLIRVFKVVATDGDIELWATNKVEMTDLERVRFASFSWTIENYHRGIKQFCLIERAQVRSCRAWRNHIGLCLRAFLRLESHCYHTGISWFESKATIIREAVRAYIANPLYSLIPTA
jgi:putative transposase